MTKAKHPKPEIEEILKYAEQRGWSIKVGGSHAWGKLYCPFNDKTCREGTFCIMSICSTPRNPSNHAKQIRQNIGNCIRYKQAQNSSEEKTD